MDKQLHDYNNKMVNSIKGILLDNIQSIYTYGSCASDDFKLGWSDIDILVLTKSPTFDDLRQDIIYHYQTIRKHAKITGRNFYSFGWFLDISRYLYTLQTGNIIYKKEAGEWALKQNLCPCIETMNNVLKIRYTPFRV